jgi:hypothetical protein
LKLDSRPRPSEQGTGSKVLKLLSDSASNAVKHVATPTFAPFMASGIPWSECAALHNGFPESKSKGTAVPRPIVRCNGEACKVKIIAILWLFIYDVILRGNQRSYTLISGICQCKMPAYSSAYLDLVDGAMRPLNHQPTRPRGAIYQTGIWTRGAIYQTGIWTRGAIYQTGIC